MKKVRILHTADFHFDTPFKEIGEKQRNISREELKDVFRNIVYLSKEREVDILLLAGDIFDNYTLNKQTLRFIEDTLSLIPNIRVFISPGNHDPYANNSFYKLVKWPDNVYIFKGTLEKVYIDDLNLNVWGAGFNQKYINISLLKDIKNEELNKINIMVIHGEMSNSSKGNEYNPISINEIKESNMDYIALGHRHSFSGINIAGRTHFAYSGCPQGRGFDELGDKGVILGEVYKGGVELEFYKTSIRNYEEEKINISDCNTYDEIRLKIINSIDEIKRKENLYKIILEGEISSKLNLDENVLSKKIRDDFYFCKIKDKTIYKYDLEDISKGYSVKSIFVKKLMKELEEADTDEEKEIIMMAIKYGLSSLSEGEVTLDDY